MGYTFSLSRRSLPVRCLCLLLIVLVLWCFFMVPRAGAVALEATTVAYAGLLVGTVLVGAGAYFASSGDMARAGAAMYQTLQKGNQAIAKKIIAISSWAVENGKKISGAALRIGQDLYQGIVDTFNSAFNPETNTFDISGSDTFVWDGTSDSFKAWCESLSDKYATLSIVDAAGVRWSCKPIREGGTYDGKWYGVLYRDGVEYVRGYICNWLPGASNYRFFVQLAYFDSWGSPYMEWKYRMEKLDGSGGRSVGQFARFYYDTVNFKADGFSKVKNGMYSVSAPVSIPVSGDLTYPSEDTLVKMPDIPSVDTATGEVAYPSDLAYTKDAVSVPYPTDADGVKVPDIPYDKVIDQSTGKVIDDADTDVDTPSKPAEGEGEGTESGTNTGLLTQIVTLLKNFFDSPSDFKLDMDGFRNLAITDKFPFCIPFDMVDSVKQFAATASDYQFRIKLDTQYFQVDHTVDLSPLALPLAFFRYLVVVWFVWVLMSRTHDLIKW